MAYCDEHKEFKATIRNNEKRIDCHDKMIKEISMKLNLILGGIVLSPFLVTVFLLLFKVKG